MQNRNIHAPCRYPTPAVFNAYPDNIESDTAVRGRVTNFGSLANRYPDRGNDLQVAHGITERVRDIMMNTPGAVDVRIHQRLDCPQIDLDVDRTKVAAVGLTQEHVVKNVLTALNSSINFLPSFWIDYKTGNHYFVGATYQEKIIDSK